MHEQIIGVESDTCPSFVAATHAGYPVAVDVRSTLADGLAVPRVGHNAFAVARPRIDRIVTVKERQTAIAVLRLIELEKAIVEGAGAVSLAALLSGQLDDLHGKKVVAILSGGNIDIPVIGRVIERGLAADGRLVRFLVSVPDRAGSIATLTTIIAEVGVGVCCGSVGFASGWTWVFREEEEEEEEDVMKPILKSEGKV
jgi:threonine dehydratase